ncbi:hypothetical protein BGX29_005430, partial [Mortierella sp. GBA35]
MVFMMQTELENLKQRLRSDELARANSVNNSPGLQHPSQEFTGPNSQGGDHPAGIDDSQ